MIYIIGPCITTVFPGDVCPLEAVVAACDRANLSAIDCTCDEGFEFQRTRCIGNFIEHIRQG